MRIAVIDIGTNSVRSRIVAVPVSGPRHTLGDEKAYTRLGRRLAETGALSTEAIGDTIEALGRMLRLAHTLEATHIRAVATAAVREASNRDELLGRAREELGLEIEVISEAEEARLAFLSAAEMVGVSGRTAVLDIGGGSAEIVLSTDEEIESVASVPLGAVVLSERFHHTDPLTPAELERLTTYVQSTLANALPDAPPTTARLIGSGGTVNAIGKMIAARDPQPPQSFHGLEIGRGDLFDLERTLAASTAKERRTMKGLPKSRVDIIVAGVVVVAEAARTLGSDALVVNAHGIREGLVIDMVRTQRDTGAPTSASAHRDEGFST